MQVVAIYNRIYGGQFCSGEAVIYRYIPAPPPPPTALFRYNIAPGSIILGAVIFLYTGQ